ncbi:hypothetical protein [Solimonas terrae]|uniref:Uncharacterized protein n=1 Tax=Solimonas terrae TaxID=1396819 RepID=A0A6M2BP13_9GAMM|nr:hypothetical protein [Solimonas terrae]NGY03797.1 hypothetical protein [Solimonas terrae]
MSETETLRRRSPARRVARAALQLYRLSLGLAGVAFLALALAHLCGAPMRLPFDSYTWYAIAFIGCLMIGIALVVGNALAGASERRYLRSAAITLGLFVLMRVAFLIGDPVLRDVAAPLLIAEILLFGGTALVFLFLRSRL